MAWSNFVSAVERSYKLPDCRPPITQAGSSLLRLWHDTLPSCTLLLLALASSAFGETMQWVLPPTQPLRVHTCRGLWSRDFHIEAALASRGGALTSDSWHHLPGGFGWLGGWDQVDGWVIDFPDSPDAITRNHLYIICNINAKALGNRPEMLREFVKNGGSLLLLGGRFAFGSQYHNTPLEELSPVTFIESGFDLKSHLTGLELKLEPGAFKGKLRDLDWSSKPSVFWIHETNPKPKSKTLLTAGDKPLLVIGEYGKGRVAIFTGTVMGAPPQTQTPFWKWAGWPRLLAETIEWLTEETDSLPKGLDKHTIARLGQMAEEEDIDLEAEDEPKARTEKLKKDSAFLLSVAARSASKESARQLIAAAAGFDGDLPPALPVAASRSIRGQVDASFSGLAKKLIASGMYHKTALGLRVLGMAGDAEAVTVLEKFYGEGDVKAGDGDAEQRPVTLSLDVLNPEASSLNKDLGAIIRHAAVAGLSNLLHAKAIPALKRIALETAAKGAYQNTLVRDSMKDMISEDVKIYQEAQMGLLHCGDATATQEVIRSLMENIYVTIRARAEENKPKEVLDRVKASVASSHDWQQQLYEKLNRVPDSVLPAVAEEIAAIKDRRAGPIAMAAFTGRKLSDEVKVKLSRSSIAAVKNLR